LLLAAPLLGLYPVFVMKLLCFALFACAFNLLLGFTGLLSFGHAAFFGFRGLRHRLGHQVAGLDAGGRHPGGRHRGRPCWACWSGWWPSAARASTSP
jgi:hypothetical protein